MSEAHPFDLHEEITSVRARSVGVTKNLWPYGPNADHTSRVLMVRWAERYGLKLSKVEMPCACWLRGKRCDDWSSDHRHFGWRDHITGWTYEGKPAVLVAQPYGLREDELAELAEIGRDPMLLVCINGTGWYGHGTTLVEIWRVDAEDAIREMRHSARQLNKDHD